MARRRNDDGLFDFFPKRRGRRGRGGMMWEEPRGRRKRRDGLLHADLFTGGRKRKKRGMLESVVRWVLRQPPDDFGWEHRVRTRQAAEEPRQ